MVAGTESLRAARSVEIPIRGARSLGRRQAAQFARDEFLDLAECAKVAEFLVADCDGQRFSASITISIIVSESIPRSSTRRSFRADGVERRATVAFDVALNHTAHNRGHVLEVAGAAKRAGRIARKRRGNA